MRVILIKLRNGIRFSENAMLVLCGVVFMALTFLDSADVLGRYLLSKPITGTAEMSVVMMGAIVLLGWGYTQMVGGHVRVDLFLNMFPSRVRKILIFASLVISLILFIVIAKQGWNIAIATLHQGNRFQLLHWLKGPFLFLVPVGAFFICLEFIIQIFESIPKLGKK
jgi:TRAP-type C4-dicarboxylate transport system permease small subunit